MIDQHGAPEKTDDQSRPSADQQAQRAERDRGNQLESMQPHQFRIAGEIGDLDQVGLVMPPGKNPSQMAVQETLVAGRMHVAFGVGMQMMVAMLRRPPQDALLRRALRQHREHELNRAAGRIRAMREVAVIAGADREDSHPVENDADCHGLPGDPRPYRRDADQMHQDERNRRRIDDVVVVGGVFAVRNHG